MSLMTVKKDGKGDEYYTPKYVVEILLPYLKLKNINTIWCPCDKEESEFVKVLKNNGYKVIFTHIENGQDFLTYEPKFNFDIIITNPPFSIKNQVVEKCISYGKMWCLLLSATCIQSASLVRILSKAKQFQFLMFDKRISYSGDRPPFPSWYFTSMLLTENKFYIYKTDPKLLFKEWKNKKEC